MKVLLSLVFLSLITFAQAETKHHIKINKYKFTPAEITIKAGDTIRWTNKEKRQYHSVWFEQLGEPEPDYFFPDEFFERTFKDIGDFPYRCGPHPKMTGMVHVLGTEKASTTSALTYTVKSVEDGDTIVVDYKGKEQRVQLIGINAPENTQNPKLNLDSKQKNIEESDLLKMGKLATDHLKELIKPGDKVSLLGNLTQKDKYNRLPAIVINEKNDSLNQLMVKNGYALLLTRFPLNDALKTSLDTAQTQAQEEKTGLWGSHAELMYKWSH